MRRPEKKSVFRASRSPNRPALAVVILALGQIKRYVCDPSVDSNPGYSPIKAKIQVTDEELDKIVAYLKTLK